MKIVFIVKWYTPGFGYITNCLSKEFESLGHEVHIFTTKYQSYWNHPQYAEIYEKYQGPNILTEGKFMDGPITIHRLPSWRFGNIIWINGLWKALKQVNPDIVQSFDINEPHTVKLAIYHRFFNYKLFTANHFILISFRLLGNWKKLDFKKKMYVRWMFKLPGSIIRRVSKKCYAVTRDAKALAHLFFGFKYNEVEVSTLGVDTRLYFPVYADDANRLQLRKELSFTDDDIVCVFSGKITQEKSPIVLAEAIAKLNEQGKNYKAIFIGSGELAPDIQRFANCMHINFVPSNELANYYRAADIAVWPRSVTTSILDAAACALPVIISDDVAAYQLYNNEAKVYSLSPNIIASKYHTNNVDDLVSKLLSLENKDLRTEIGKIVQARIDKYSSWKAIAQKRLHDYLNL